MKFNWLLLLLVVVGCGTEPEPKGERILPVENNFTIDPDIQWNLEPLEPPTEIRLGRRSTIKRIYVIDCPECDALLWNEERGAYLCEDRKP